MIGAATTIATIRFLTQAQIAEDAQIIAEKLRRVLLDISLNLTAVVLANGAYNTSKLADINRIVAALRADVAALRADVAYNT